jgi:hypothetical protein
MRKALEIGGFVAALVLIAFGVGAIVLGFEGRDTVTESLKKERITGSPDMTPSEIAKEAKGAGLTNVSLPSCSVAGKLVDSGGRARCFAQYMRVHALEATGGFTYSQMGRFAAKPGAPKSELAEGGGTESEEFAVKDPKTGKPAENGARNVWVTETALSTALNTSYMADRTALFGIVVGIALLLTGVGFAILVASGAIRDPQSVFRRRSRPESAPPPAA